MIYPLPASDEISTSTRLAQLRSVFSTFTISSLRRCFRPPLPAIYTQVCPTLQFLSNCVIDTAYTAEFKEISQTLFVIADLDSKDGVETIKEAIASIVSWFQYAVVCPC